MGIVYMSMSIYMGIVYMSMFTSNSK